MHFTPYMILLTSDGHGKEGWNRWVDGWMGMWTGGHLSLLVTYFVVITYNYCLHTAVVGRGGMFVFSFPFFLTFT